MGVLKLESLKKFCKEKSITFFFPISIILTIVPLIVRLKTLNPDKATLDIFGIAAKSDLFVQYKAIALMFFSILLLVIAIIFFKSIFEKRDKLTIIILISSLVFLFFTFLSSIFSSYKQVAFWGIYDRAEGFFTICCYIVLFIYSIYAFKNTKDYKNIIIPIIIVVCINAFLGLFQYFNHDLIKTSLGGLIVGINPEKLVLNNGPGSLYGTLYHYNYVGSFAAIVLPIIIGSFFFEDDVFLKIMLMLSGLCGIWLLFGSTSRAGLLAVCGTIVISLIIFGKVLFKSWKPVAISIGVIGIIAIGLNFATGGKIFSRIPSLVSDAVQIFSNSKDYDYTDYTPIRNIEHGEDGHVDITLNNHELLKIYYENNEFIFKDTEGNIINYDKNIDPKTKAANYATSNETYSNIAFRAGNLNTKTKYDMLLLIPNGYKGSFMFNVKNDNSIHLFNTITMTDMELEFPETIGFNGKEKLASARGYIWSRSLPLLRGKLILGSGPDTFPFDFPQNDLIGKLYAYDTTNMAISKAHNFFLQTGINNGIIALVALIVTIFAYVIDSFKLYSLRKKYSELQLMGAVTFLGIIGYLIASMFNDSVICVAPFFWVILGVGVSLNYMNKKELNN